jgi:hypothetical protein
MWKLIFALALWLWINPSSSDPIILVADDCLQWRTIVPNKKSNRHSIVKSIPVFHRVMLIHDWMIPEDSLSTIDLTYSEILKLNPQFTSELTAADWDQLTYGKDKKKIFMLKPDDFCSEKRFSFDHKFTLLEVRIHLSGNE